MLNASRCLLDLRPARPPEEDEQTVKAALTTNITFLVSQRPLVAAVVITAAKEEVR